MAREEQHDIILVSDFHLSAGYDPATGTYHRNEDFFYDAAFARFLADLRARGEREGRTWRLVLLGDVFDFLQVEAHTPRGERGEPETSVAATITKLERVAAGHPEFFAALGSFIGAGYRLDIVPGNHDVELTRHTVQARFRELVEERSGEAGVGERIRFHPWVLYVPGVLYAEHGQQYDRDNSFATLLAPYALKEPGELDLPLGSYFVEYLFDRIEALDPFADNVKPPTRYLRWAFRVHPIVALGMLGTTWGSSCSCSAARAGCRTRSGRRGAGATARRRCAPIRSGWDCRTGRSRR